MWHDRLAPAWEPGVTMLERQRRIAQALARKGYKIQVKDLTPELQDIADDYIENLGGRKDSFSPGETWLPDAKKWLRRAKGLIPSNPLRAGPNIEHLRARALNEIVKNFGAANALEAPALVLLPPEPAQGP